MLRRALLLDRDGTVIVHEPYLADPELVRLVPGAADALRRAKARGYSLVLVSNQAAVARGLFDARALERVHARMVELLAAEGLALDGTYYCLHAPEADCACRKPRPGLLLQAARELGIDLAASVMVGDKPLDVEAGRAAGCGASVLLEDWAKIELP